MTSSPKPAPTKAAKQPPVDPELEEAMKPLLPPSRARLTQAEIASAMAPLEALPPLVKEPPPPIQVPSPPLPPSAEAELERLRSAGLVREEGAGEFPPPFVLPKQRLTITERDGRETVLEFVPDYGGAFLMVEWPSPRPGEPWIVESNAARVGIASIASLTLEDVEPG